MAYEVSKNSRRCFVSGRTLEPGDVFFSVLIETATGSERRDYAKENWQGPPEGTIGFWKGRIPESSHSDKPKPITPEAMFELFESLEEKEEPSAHRLRYVLALLLIRRKALKLQGVERSQDGDALIVRSIGSSSKTYTVPDADLSEEQMELAEQELAGLLESAAE